MLSFDLRGHVNMDPIESQQAEGLEGGTLSVDTWQDVNENCTFAAAAQTMIDYGYGDPLAPEQWREIATPGFHGGEEWQATVSVIQARPDLFPDPPPMSIERPGDVTAALRFYGRAGYMAHFAGYCTPDAHWTDGDYNDGISHAGRIIYGDQDGIGLWNPWTGYLDYESDDFWRRSWDGGGILVFHRSLIGVRSKRRPTMDFIVFGTQQRMGWVDFNGNPCTKWCDPSNGVTWQRDDPPTTNGALDPMGLVRLRIANGALHFCAQAKDGQPYHAYLSNDGDRWAWHVEVG